MTKNDLRKTNWVHYYRVLHFHKDIFGFNRPCNVFEFQHLLGSERCSDNFEKEKLDDHYISYIPLIRFGHIRRGGMMLTPEMAKSYPWQELSDSIKEEGLRVPIHVEIYNRTWKRIRVVEGKHRTGAISLIKPYNPDYPVPCLATIADPFYTIFMHKKAHPDPGNKDGFRRFDER